MLKQGTNATSLRSRLLLALIALQTAFWLPYANAQEGDPRREHERRERERDSRRNPPPDRPRERPDHRPEPRPEPPRDRPNPRPEPPRDRPHPRPEPPRDRPHPRPEPPRERPDERDRRERDRREREERDRRERDRRDRAERDRWERDRWERDRWEREEQARRERERRDREERDRGSQVLAAQTYEFRYNKPHDEMMWNVSSILGSSAFADQLVISSTGTGGMKGTNGIVGISRAVVYYTDGTQTDLVAQQVRQGDIHVRKGLLRLIDENDVLVIPLNSGRAVHAVYIRADSWINANAPVELLFSLEQHGMFLP